MQNRPTPSNTRKKPSILLASIHDGLVANAIYIAGAAIAQNGFKQFILEMKEDPLPAVLILVLEVAWEWDYGSWKEWFDGMDVGAALVQG